MESKMSLPQMRQLTDLCLHGLVNEILVCNTLRLTANRTIILNEIQSPFFIQAETSGIKEIIATIINLLSLEIKDGVVRIYTRVYSDMVLIHFTENSTAETSAAFLEALLELVPIVETHGGRLGMKTNGKGEMTIVLTLLHIPELSSRNNFERLAQHLVASKYLNTQEVQSNSTTA